MKYLQQHEIFIGQKVLGDFTVIAKTAKTVKIKLYSTSHCWKPLTFRWDGTGFKRQGEYLTGGVK